MMDAAEMALEAKFTAILRETTSLTATDDEWIASAAKVLCRIAVEHYADALDAAEAELAELKRPPERCPSCGMPSARPSRRMIHGKMVACNDPFHVLAGETMQG